MSHSAHDSKLHQENDSARSSLFDPHVSNPPPSEPSGQGGLWFHLLSHAHSLHFTFCGLWFMNLLSCFYSKNYYPKNTYTPICKVLQTITRPEKLFYTNPTGSKWTSSVIPPPELYMFTRQKEGIYIFFTFFLHFVTRNQASQSQCLANVADQTGNVLFLVTVFSGV